MQYYQSILRLQVVGCVVAVLSFAAACSNGYEKPVEREYGTNFFPEASSSFHAAEFSIAPCTLLGGLQLEQANAASGSTEAFSFLRYINVETANGLPNMRLGAMAGESPFLLYVLRSERLRNQVEISDADFFDLAKLNLKLLPCALEESPNWNYGCRYLWDQTMVGRGCSLDSVADQPHCASTWNAIRAQQELGRCSYVQTSPPAADDAVCREAKQKLVMLTLLKQQNRLYLAKNKILEEKFPGIFGSPGDGSKSLLGGILSRIPDFPRIGPEALNEILTKRVALFPESRSWDHWARDVRNVTAALTVGLAPDSPPAERLCSAVLAQRLFGQVLALNGFVRPELKDGNLEPLSAARAALGSVPVAGAYLRRSADGAVEPTILSPQELEAYNPASGLLLAGKQTPMLHSENAAPQEFESFPDRLSRLEGLELAFEATSPVANWLNEPGRIYPLGDLEVPGGHALLPAEAHALIFAHLALNFRNLAALNLKQLNAQGSLLRDGERPMGFVLLRSLTPDQVGDMYFNDLLRFTKLLVRFDEVAQKLLLADPRELRRLNSFYSDSVLARVRETSQNLRRLKLPLILLLKQMAEQTGSQVPGINQCVGAIRFNWREPVESRRRILLSCTEAEWQEYQSVRQLVERSILGERN